MTMPFMFGWTAQPNRKVPTLENVTVKGGAPRGPKLGKPELTVCSPSTAFRAVGRAARGLRVSRFWVPPHQYGTPAGSFVAGASVLVGIAMNGTFWPLAGNTTVWKPNHSYLSESPLWMVITLGW